MATKSGALTLVNGRWLAIGPPVTTSVFVY
jgi:hypothetical protein